MDFREAILKNWLTSVGGLMASIPMLVTSSGFTLSPQQQHWIALIGGIGALVLGLSAKMSSNHSTQAQVTASTVEAKADAAVQQAATPPGNAK